MSKVKLKHGTRTDRTRPATLSAEPWNNLPERILSTLRSASRMTVVEIAGAMNEDRGAIQKALIDLDDQERVHMRNGWYSLSAKERLSRI